MLRITVLVLCSLLSSCNSEPTETAFQIPKIYPHHGKSVCDRIFRLLSVSGFDDISNSLKTPRTLDESFVELDHMVNDQMKMWIRCLEDGEFAGRAHFSLGMYLRNNWGLWRGTTLNQHFNKMGIFHPDDMSGIILVSYQRHLKGEDIRLQEQVERYQAFWKDQQPDKDGNMDLSRPSLSDYQ